MARSLAEMRLRLSIIRAQTFVPTKATVADLFQQFATEIGGTVVYSELLPKLQALVDQYNAGQINLTQALDSAHYALVTNTSTTVNEFDTDNNAIAESDFIDDFGSEGADNGSSEKKELTLAAGAAYAGLGKVAVTGQAAGELNLDERDAVLGKVYEGAAQAAVMTAASRFDVPESSYYDTHRMLIEGIRADIQTAGSNITNRLLDGSISQLQANAQFAAAVRGATWGSQQKAANGFAKSASKNFAWWVRDHPKEGCDDCYVLEEESPYPIDELPCLPADGTTQCDIGCLCHVEYTETDGTEDDNTDDEDNTDGQDTAESVDRILRRLRRRVRAIKRDYNPSESRDERGRWATGGGNAVGDEEIGQWGDKKLGATAASNAPASVNQKVATSSWGPYGDLDNPTIGTTRDIVGRATSMMTDIANDPDQTDFKQGMNWYKDAHDFATEQAAATGISVKAACAVTASLSPQCEWGLNQRLAAAVMAIATNRQGQTLTFAKSELVTSTGKPIALKDNEGHTVKFVSDKDKDGNDTGKMTMDVHDIGLKVMASISPDLKGQSANNLEKAFKLAGGADIDKTLGGNKVRSFYNSIVTKGEGNYACVDTHMIRMLSGDDKLRINGETASAIMGQTGTYNFLADSVRQASKQLEGKIPGITPEKLQATLWTRWLRLHGPESQKLAAEEARAKK